MFITTILILVYEWFIARTALDISGLIAAVLVATNTGVVIAIGVATVSLAQG